MVRLPAVVMFLMLAGCSQFGVQSTPNADRDAEERTVRDLDAEWAKAAAAKNVDQVMSFYAEDGAIFVPNEPVAMGKPAVRVEWTKLTSNPGFALTFSPSRVDVSKAGDLAYEYGVYTLMLSGGDGKPINDRGKYVVVWKKQSDGKWKVEADIFNSDLPMSSPAA
jgi:uncharacterized protein (TIGR02246 family)